MFGRGDLINWKKVCHWFIQNRVDWLSKNICKFKHYHRKSPEHWERRTSQIINSMQNNRIIDSENGLLK